MTTIASGSTPDIFQNYWNNAPTWANNGALYDLTEFVNGGDAEWNKDDFIDAAWDVCTYEDKVYSTPSRTALRSCSTTRTCWPRPAGKNSPKRWTS